MHDYEYIYCKRSLKLTYMKQATEEVVTQNIYRLVFLSAVFICTCTHACTCTHSHTHNKEENGI